MKTNAGRMSVPPVFFGPKPGFSGKIPRPPLAWRRSGFRTEREWLS